MKQKFKLTSAILFAGIIMATVFILQPATGGSIISKSHKLSIIEQRTFVDIHLRIMNAPPTYIGANPYNENTTQYNTIFIGNSNKTGNKNIFMGFNTGKSNTLTFIDHYLGHSDKKQKRLVKPLRY